MIGFARTIGEIGAGFISLLLTLAIFAAGIAACRLAYRFLEDRSAWIRRPALVAIFVAGCAVAALLIVPSQEAVNKVACRSAGDFELCMEGGPDSEY